MLINPYLAKSFFSLTLYSMLTPFDTFEYQVLENILENGAFALLEQMLHFL